MPSESEQEQKRLRVDEADHDRMYGSGLGEEQQELLEFIDQGENVPAVIELPILKRMLQKFARTVAKNSQMRSKYCEQPLKYADSEADLAESVNVLTSISSVPEHFPVLVQMDTHTAILGLLSHENIDIALSAVALLEELTDEDMVVESEEAGRNGVDVLVKALVKNDIVALLVQTLDRCDETIPEESQGVFSILSSIESMMSVDADVADAIASTGLVPWLLNRISRAKFDSVRQYASELASIIIIHSKCNAKFAECGVVETLLKILSIYRKSDPIEADETEMVGNLFDTLCVALSLKENKDAFLASEGLELMLIMIRERKAARIGAIKVIDHALTGASSQGLCNRFVDIMGLGFLFGCFMGSGMTKFKKKYMEFSSKDDQEHIISILSCLLKHCDESQLHRVYAKLVENDFEKLAKLLEIYHQYQTAILVADEALELRAAQNARKLAVDDASNYLERLDAGLFTLQLLAVILLQLASSNAHVYS